MKHLKLVLFIFALIATKNTTAQIIDVDNTFTANQGIKQQVVGPSAPVPPPMPQLLSSGFVNYLTNGSIQAAANLVKINVGNPNGFYMPFYIYTGTSGGGLGNSAPSATSIGNLLNPIGGTVNLSFNGLQLIGKRTGYTCVKFAYQVGGRVSSGRDSLTQQNFTFFNGFANIGFYFQTQAWVDGDQKNMGMFFVMLKGIGTFSDKENFQKIIGDQSLNSNYLIGYSIDAGIEINKVIDAKLGVYQYTNDNVSAVLNRPVVSLTLNYLLGKSN